MFIEAWWWGASSGWRPSGIRRITLTDRSSVALSKISKKVTGVTDFVSAALAFTPAGMLAKPIVDAVKATGEEIADECNLENIRDDLAKALRA
jgi:hypothetical protein